MTRGGQCHRVFTVGVSSSIESEFVNNLYVCVCVCVCVPMPMCGNMCVWVVVYRCFSRTKRESGKTEKLQLIRALRGPSASNQCTHTHAHTH